MAFNFFISILGIILLAAGAKILIKGASALALLCKLAPAVIGLTIVAVGTSLPELFVGLKAVMASNSDLLLGNIIGSNIMNIALVLGLSSLIFPISISKQSRLIEWPIMFGFSVLVMGFMFNLYISRIEGAILFILFTSAIFYFIYIGRKTHNVEVENETEEILELKKIIDAQSSKGTFLIKYGALVIVGIGMLQVGAELFVKGASELALMWGVSQRVIGLSIVAVGTSLPELSVSIIGALKGRSDIAVGNILGSNIFNIGGILGLCTLIKPISVGPTFPKFDMPWLLGICLLLFLFMWLGQKIKRWNGFAFLTAYGVYLYKIFGS